MHLGIEIGGTKLQLGMGAGGDGPLVALERRSIDPAAGATGILAQIEDVARGLARAHAISGVGIGFGGPVDAARGTVVTSHQIRGWDGFPLVEWCAERLGLPAVLGNDCDVAALAEAVCGAGRGRRVVFYVTVGSGVGGGLAVEGRSYRGGSLAVAEIGHLRPGLDAVSSRQTVEALASGWGIAAAARTMLAEGRRGDLISAADAADLHARCGGSPERLTAQQVFAAASAGNGAAQGIVDRALAALGWAIAQAITLLGPEVVVVGGGVSLAGDAQFFAPLRRETARYVFPPLADRYQIVPAELGEAMVVHGAVTLSADAFADRRSRE